VVNIERALRVPLAEGGLVKTIIGALLNLIPIVSFLSSGYLLELMGNAAKEKHEMPAWENWGAKFINGFLVLIIALIYMLIPLIIISACGGLEAYCQGGGWGLLSGAFALATIVAMIIGFFIPMALAHFAYSGSFSAAFSLGTIFSYIGKVIGSYVLAYILIIALAIAMMIVSIIPILGFIICIFAGFYIGCVGSILFGDAYRQARAADAGAGTGA